MAPTRRNDPQPPKEATRTDNIPDSIVADDHPLVAAVLRYRDEIREAEIRAAQARAELSNAEIRAAACERILAEHMARLAEHPGAVSRLAELDRQTEAQVTS